MKKFMRNLCLLLLPILLYYTIFLALEPNNYFGLRATTPSGTPLGALREYEKNPVNSIIVGDSRMAHFDMDIVQKTANRPFANLAYGGASFNETLDLMEWWLDEYPNIDEVVVGLSFYTINTAYQFDRIPGLKETLHNPFAYLTNLSFHLETLEQLKAFLAGKPLYGGDSETEDPADYTFLEYETPGGETVMLRSRIAQYIGYIQPRASIWQPDTETINAFIEFVNRQTTQNGVRFAIVLPPMHSAILEYVVKYYGIEYPMLALIQRLRSETPALVLDYEISAAGRPDYTDDMFFDGFHLDAKRGLTVWTETLFTDIDTAPTADTVFCNCN